MADQVASLIDPDLKTELFALVKARLASSEAHRPAASVEARWIVAEALKSPENGESARANAQAMTTRRLNGEPLSRIFGNAEFYGLELGVNEATLDPRNDTEALVDLVLDHFDSSPLSFADLGTGTGAIALALLSQRPTWEGLSCDVSAEALEQAGENARALGFIERLRLRESDWYQALEGERFDLIVSNPPYLTSTEMTELDQSVKGFDPDLALFGGDDGSECYRKIFAGANAHLTSTGMVAVEIGWKQKSDLIELAKGHGFRLIESRQDLGQRDRALLFALEH